MLQLPTGLTAIASLRPHNISLDRSADDLFRNLIESNRGRDRRARSTQPSGARANVTFRFEVGVALSQDVVKDGFYRIVGAIIYYALLIVDRIQSMLGIQKKKRPLTEDERGILWKVFRNSLNYNAISIVNGKAGILGVSGRPFTMGFTIYLPSNNDAVLVHGCVHVWQFQFGGTKYIGNSALNQLDSMLINKGYDPYSWASWIAAGNSWYTLKSAEAQAQFIQDVFTEGEFVFIDKTTPSDSTRGAFFKEEEETGHNKFSDYTDIANEAWRIIRTGSTIRS